MIINFIKKVSINLIFMIVTILGFLLFKLFLKKEQKKYL